MLYLVHEFLINIIVSVVEVRDNEHPDGPVFFNTIAQNVTKANEIWESAYFGTA